MIPDAHVDARLQILSMRPVHFILAAIACLPLTGCYVPVGHPGYYGPRPFVARPGYYSPRPVYVHPHKVKYQKPKHYKKGHPHGYYW